MLEVVEINGPALLLQARGRINSRTALAFETAARRAFAGTDQDVIIDASQVTYLSTAAYAHFCACGSNSGRKTAAYTSAPSSHIFSTSLR